jgi:hypothetical protein
MSLAALLNLGGGEVILTLALEGSWQGFKEFRKALLTGQEAEDVRPSHQVLMAVTFILGAASLIQAEFRPDDLKALGTT